MEENIRPQERTLDHVHPEYALLTAEERRERAYNKLQERILAGQRRAAVALGRILSEEPKDALVRMQAMKVAPIGEQFNVGQGTLHRHALDQLATRLGFNTRFMHSMQGTEWGRLLIAHNLNELAAHADPDDRLLVRTVDGTVRGVLSSSFRTEDSRPAVDALIGVAEEVGAIVADASALDVKNSVRLMLREPVEVFPGEYAVFGLDYTTSDYGAGGRDISGWVERLLCLNGAVVSTSYRRVHLGRRMDDDVAFSEATRQLNSRAAASAARDIGRLLLGKDSVAKLVEKVRAANAAELDPDRALASIRKDVNKEEEKRIVEKYNSPDVELLPPGNTKWRFSNAISWLANQSDPARKLELEQLAGRVIESA